MNPDQILMNLDPNTFRCTECGKCIDEQLNIYYHRKCNFGSSGIAGGMVCIFCGWPVETEDYHIYKHVIRYLTVTEIECIYYNFYDIHYDELNSKIVFTLKPEKDESV